MRRFDGASWRSCPARRHPQRDSVAAENVPLRQWHQLLDAAAVRELRLAGGERVLDVGCGEGLLARELSRVASGIRVLRIEASAEQLTGAVRMTPAVIGGSAVEYRLGDASALPLREGEWGSFDLAHARCVLEHVADPRPVVAGIVRAVRPGGRIVLQDEDHGLMHLWPEPQGFRELWKSYVRLFHQLNKDPYIGRRLVALLREAGGAPLRNMAVFCGGCAGSPTWAAAFQGLVGTLELARDPLLRAGLLNRSKLEASLASLRRWGRRSDASIWYCLMWAEAEVVRQPGASRTTSCQEMLRAIPV
jgi:SAM-dependent methyltransferase